MNASRSFALVLRFAPGALAPAASSFLLTLGLARVLDPSQLGWAGVGLSVAALISGAGTQWLAQPILRFLPGRPLSEEFSRDLQLLVFRSAALSALGAILLTVGVAALPRGEIPVADAVALAGAVGALVYASVVGGVAASLLQAIGSAERYSLKQSGMAAGRLVGGLACALVAQVAWAPLVGAAVGVMVGARQATPAQGNLPAVRHDAFSHADFIAYGRPFVVWSLLSAYLSVGDRLVLSQTVEAAAVGQYAVNYTIAAGLLAVPSTPLLLWVQRQFMALWNQNQQDAARRVAVRVICVIGTVGFSAALISWLVGSAAIAAIAGAGYVGDPRLLPQLICGATLWQVCLLLQKPIEASTRSAALSRRIGVAALFNLFVTYALSASHGILGASVATVLSYLLYACSVWLVGWGEQFGSARSTIFVVTMCVGVIALYSRMLAIEQSQAVVLAVAFLFALLIAKCGDLSGREDVATPTAGGAPS